MKYKYIGGEQYVQGLPATDIDDSVLTSEQQDMLALAVEKGLYVPENGAESKKGKSRLQSATEDDSAPAAG